ncbi:DUF6783 domain-containing protein [uncultured Robinsoniella sp.]|uniref:DUF6783 domain-containing protein n=1 Tax=uncultured Robinsoniella sp. TaxID=904190 RepID=UPI00374FAE5D
MRIAFRKLWVTLCGRFVPDEGHIAGYVTCIWNEYAAKWGVHMAGINLQTGSIIIESE